LLSDVTGNHDSFIYVTETSGGIVKESKKGDIEAAKAMVSAKSKAVSALNLTV